MKKIKLTFLLCVVGFLLSGKAFGNEKTIKLSIMYTASVASKVSDIKQQAENQINIIKTVLQNSGINDVIIEVSYTKLTKYIEPQNRTNGYIRFPFDGTYQILDEVSNHAKLMDYFIDNNVNSFDQNGVNYIDKSELSQSLISIDASTKNNIVLFIVDENGPAIISEYFPKDLTGRTSKTFYSIINYQVFSNLDISLALGFFGIFTSINDADLDIEDEPSNSSLMSFWVYDDASVLKKLSDANKSSFLCNLSKLNLKAPALMEIGGMLIVAETENSVIEANNSIVIVPYSDVNKRPFSVIAPDADDYSIVFTNVRKKPRVNDPICVVPNERQISSDNIQFIEPDEEEIVEETITEVEYDTNVLPPYPNPTNGELNFEMYIAETGFYKLAMYDITTGKQMNVIHKGNLEKGEHTIKTNVSNLRSGLYIYRLESTSLEPITGRIIVK
ncbi:hypothetical protein KORDIASMS9_02995 [Kordia sp. SMS9]|uniref:T9SS type A sorting domain-containing protein n=1 Tax=Kordia sp. SMS9 TaxID=2282170 RepID=UPI000E0CED05|nr:T9SS type A sorting domain-containing protein [Kordia sp. SMS9]AXG70749.1 hypothetical protein KORDIASMS9_02995 [Kordia sp. SMS9]